LVGRTSHWEVFKQIQIGAIIDSAQKLVGIEIVEPYHRPIEVIVPYIDKSRFPRLFTGKLRQLRRGPMRPQKPEEGDLFRARLDQIINLKHELV
jgi:hypothetical protein